MTNFVERYFEFQDSDKPHSRNYNSPVIEFTDGAIYSDLYGQNHYYYKGADFRPGDYLPEGLILDITSDRLFLSSTNGLVILRLGQVCSTNAAARFAQVQTRTACARTW